ncbi:uncharacterized protein LOC124173145 [Ischnura elegans]|uniref:uncharacterized protein LOC124173145 n=1 Tax=Ischnura elegans TaxID=197161 RepID=UPI001ED8A994|nr:uncharacterized protein LOC124173145 [Ischnura elegans]
MHLFVNNTAVASPPLPRLSTSLSEEQFLPEEIVKRMLDEREYQLERRMKAVVEECVSSLLEKHFSKLEDMISSLIQSRGSEAGGELCSSGVLTAQNSIPHKIHIGYGVQMDQKHYESMMGAKQKSDWATCLIQGVFGPEGKKMRQYPRTESLKAVPRAFISAAKDLARKWLEADSFSGDVERELEKLPAYLSRRARDLNGRRRSDAAYRQTMPGWRSSLDEMQITEGPTTVNVGMQEREELVRADSGSLGHALAEAVTVVMNGELNGSADLTIL